MLEYFWDSIDLEHRASLAVIIDHVRLKGHLK